MSSRVSKRKVLFGLFMIFVVYKVGPFGSPNVVPSVQDSSARVARDDVSPNNEQSSGYKSVSLEEFYNNVNVNNVAHKSSTNPPGRRSRCGYDDDLNLQVMAMREEKLRQQYGSYASFTCEQLVGLSVSETDAEKKKKYYTEAVRSYGLLQSIEFEAPQPARSCKAYLDNAHLTIKINKGNFTINDELQVMRDAYQQCSFLADSVCQNQSQYTANISSLCRIKKQKQIS